MARSQRDVEQLAAGMNVREPGERTCGFPEGNTLPVVAPGRRLDEGAVYLNLANPARGPFRALHGQCVGTRDRVIAAADVAPSLWDALIRKAAYAGLFVDADLCLGQKMRGC